MNGFAQCKSIKDESDFNILIPSLNSSITIPAGSWGFLQTMMLTS